MGIKISTLFVLLSIYVSVMLCTVVSIAPAPEPEATMYLIFTQQPESNDPKVFHIKTLTTVLGSEEAAKKALVYSYKRAMSGFCAKLTPAQVEKMLDQPGVLLVIPSKILPKDLKPSDPGYGNGVFGNS